RARELMTRAVVSVGRDTSLAEVARTMVERRLGCVPVVDKHGRLCGIITQTNFSADEQGMPFSTEALLQMCSRPEPPGAMEKARRDALTTRAGEVMTTEVTACREETPLDEVARLMLRYDIDHIPVVRDGVPVGIVARHDFLRMIAGE